MSKLIINLNIDEQLRNNFEEKLKNKNLLIEDYISVLIKKDIESEISFNGYTFNLIYEKLFFENKEIKLTNIEMKLFKYLLNNANALVRIEDINSNVWENKKMTLFTLRNKINSIERNDKK